MQLGTEHTENRLIANKTHKKTKKTKDQRMRREIIFDSNEGIVIVLNGDSSLRNLMRAGQPAMHHQMRLFPTRG
jgi:hypothetical protein